jgi:NAD(P)-dependent dehydrogenase (short-subunit alcohol dehydrogenase family)
MRRVRRDSVAAMVKATVDTFGRLDMAFNNADEPAEVFDRVNAINLRGVWACMKHELAQMRGQGSGAIVNCSSLGGLVGLPGRAAYHASKHGVIGLTTSAALEYAPRGIRINAVCPGTIETPMVTDMIAKGALDTTEAVANQPIARLGRADEIPASVLWLCSPGASFIVGVAPTRGRRLHRTLITAEVGRTITLLGKVRSWLRIFPRQATSGSDTESGTRSPRCSRRRPGTVA